MSGSPSEEQLEGARIDWGAPDRVELAIPARPELRVLARLAASTVAASMDLGVDEIEDLRLAIDELCISCAAGAGPKSRLRLCFEHDADSLHAECVADQVVDDVAEISDDDGLQGELSSTELSRRILAELVDDYAIGPVIAGQRRCYLEKRRQTAVA